MTNRYRYFASLSWGGDEPTAELEVEVEYSVAWGSPATGHYGPPENYDPGSDSEVEDITILTVDGKPGPWGDAFMTTDADAEDIIRNKLEMDHEGFMVEEASENEAAAYEAAEEAKWEERRLERSR